MKLSSFLITPVDEASAPSFVKLFKNQDVMDFDECESDKATQEFNVKESDMDKKIKLKFVKF